MTHPAITGRGGGLLRGTGGYSQADGRDAFNRVRVSDPYTSFSYSNVTDNPSLYFFTRTTGGGNEGTSFLANSSAQRLTLESGVTGSCTFRSKRYVLYQPGKSQYIKITGAIRDYSHADVFKRVGYFDDNDGVFFEFNDSLCYFVRRTSTSGSPVDNKTLVDVSDFDLTKTHLFWFDLEWLGVGRYRGGIVDPATNEQLIFHEGVGAGTLQTVYMRSATLPPSWEIASQNLAAGSPEQLTMDAICTAVESEGGLQQPGIELNHDVAFTSAGAAAYPVVLLAQQDAVPWSLVVPTALDVMCSSASVTYKIQLVLNPTLSAPASFSNKTGSVAKVAAPPNTITASGGTVLATSYDQTGTSPNPRGRISIPPTTLPLGRLSTGDPDVLAVVITQLTAGNNSFYASLNWREAF